MKRISILATLFGLMSVSATAFACGGEANMFVIGLFIAPFLALPYTLFGTAVIASQARQWFRRPWLGWIIGTFGAWVACSAGGVAGFGLAQLAKASQLHADNLQGALILSTPFVFEVAYLMWLHSRRPRS